MARRVTCILTFSILAGILGIAAPCAAHAEAANVHHVINGSWYLHPGSTTDFARPPWYDILPRDHTCDWKYDPAKSYQQWLQSDPHNQLIVVTGKDSEMKEDDTDPKSLSTYAGLWQYYFANVVNTSYAGQVTICDYNYMEHATVLENFASLMDSPFTGTCPPSPDNQHYALHQWNPYSR